jgi:hypothetical protein
MIEVYFKCQCGEPVLAMLHKHEDSDMAICECGRRYKVYKPIIEEVK